METDGSAPAVEVEPEPDVTDGEGAAPEVTEEPGGASAAPEGEDDPEFVSFVQKVLGDEELDERTARGKLGKEYWAQKNANARLAKEAEDARRELQELKARGLATVSPPRTTEPEKPAPPAAAPKVELPPDTTQRVQAIDSRVNSLVKEHNGNIKTHDNLLQECGVQVREIGKIEGRLEMASELDKPMWEMRLQQAKDALQLKMDRVEYLRTRNADLRYEREQRLLERQNEIRRAQETQARQKQAEANVALFNETFPQDFDNEVWRQADEIGIPADEKTRMALWRYVNHAAMADLRTMQGDNIDEVDMGALIQSKVNEWLEDHNLTGRLSFARQSKEKLNAAARLRTPVRSGSKTPAPTTPRKPWDDPPKDKLALARERLNRVLPGL